MKNVLLLLDQRENRRLLLDNLADHHHVAAPEPVAKSVKEALAAPLDLIIVDGVALSRFRGHLEARRAEENGIFLPIMLVTARKDVGLHTGNAWTLIDDVLLTPVERIELRPRVIVLLRARALSQDAAERYAVLAETSPMGIAVEQDGRFVYCNRICGDICAALGDLSHEELLSYLHRIRAELDPRALRSAGLGAGQGMGQIEIDSDSGSYWIDVRWAHHIYQSHPAIMYLIDDVTDQKAAERALVQAKEKAVQMERMKSAFLTNMSHEIRTPLTGIIGYAELMRQEATGELAPMVEAIYTSGERLLETLNSVLDLAQIEGKAVKVRPSRFDVRAAVVDSVKLVEPAARDKHLQLVKDLPDDPVWFYSDRSLIGRILANLLSNAVKFTEEGSVTVSVQPLDEGVNLVVRDTGIGISEEFLPHIFREFEQASTGLARKFEGSGLGLSIVRALVELIGGRISVDSISGEGTVFSIFVPAITPSNPESPHPSAKPGSPAQHLEAERVSSKVQDKDDAGEELSVLVVEDNVHARRVLTRFLSEDCVVTAVGGTELALALASAQSFDLVIVDIALSEDESGIDLLRRLRSDLAYDHVPIVACTAYALPGDREQLLEVGFDGYVSKPFNRLDILELIERVRKSVR